MCTAKGSLPLILSSTAKSHGHLFLSCRPMVIDIYQAHV